MHNPWSRHVLLPFLLALAAITAQVVTKPMHAPIGDALVYVKLANELHQYGTLTSAGFEADAEAGSPSRFFSPAYPTLLAAAASLSPPMAAAIECHSNAQQPCPGHFAAIVAIQTVMAAGIALLGFLIAAHLSGSAVVAWLTMAVMIATGELGHYARTYLTEILTWLTLSGFFYFAMTAIDAGSRWRYLTAGLSLGICVLTRPSYLYLLIAAVPFLAAILIVGKKSSAFHALGRATIVAAGGLAIIGPWMLRNYAYFGDVALTHGYGALSLAVRVAYNQMSWTEWAVSLIYWLPDFGDKLAATLFAPEHYIRLKHHAEGITTYFNLGYSLYSTTLTAAGSPEHHLSYLLKHNVLGDFLKHVMVSISLSFRGMWAGDYVALAGFILLAPVTWMMAQRQRLSEFILLAVPLYFMLGLHAFVSLNVPRYNIAMITLFAFIVSFWAYTMTIDRFTRWRSTPR